MATAQMNVGGMNPVDPKRPDVVEAAKFALNDRYYVEDISYKILTSLAQSISGMKYFLKIAVTETHPDSCTVMSYEVWDKAGAPADNPHTLESVEEQFHEKC